MSAEYGSSRNIVRNTVALGATRGLERITTFVLSFFIARALGAPGLGVYSAAIAYFSVISVAAEMGAPNYLIREIAKCPELTSRYVVHLSVMTALPCSIAVAASFFIVPHLGYSHELTLSVYIVIVAAMAGIIKTIQEAVFVAHQKVEFVAYSTLVSALGCVAVSLILLYKGYGIIAIVAAFAITQYLVVGCYFALLTRYVSRLHVEFRLSVAIQLAKDIKVFAGSSVLSALAGRPEIIILSVLTDDAHIGFYSAALRISEAWSLIPETYMTNVYSVLSHSYHVADRARSQLIISKSIQYLLAVALPLSVGIAICARPILSAIYGRGFEPSVLLLQTLSCCIPIASLTAVLWRVLAARDQQHLMLRAQVITTVTRLAIGFILIVQLSAFGAALSTAFATILFNMLLNFYVRRDGTRLGIFRLAWRNSLAAIGMAIAIVAITKQAQLWIVVALGVSSYAVFVILFKGLSSDDFVRLRKVLPTRTQS